MRCLPLVVSVTAASILSAQQRLEWRDARSLDVFRLASFFGQVDKIGPVVRSYTHVDARELTFAEQPDGTRTAQVEVLAVTFGDNGDVADQSNRRYTVTLTADRFARACSIASRRRTAALRRASTLMSSMNFPRGTMTGYEDAGHHRRRCAAPA
jgi:hypothetical protein